MSFATSNVGWAVGDDGPMLKTANGGKSWTVQTTSAEERLRAVTCVSSKKVWPVGDGGAFYDGGANWAQGFTSSSYDHRAVAFTSANNGWAVDKLGSVLTATDGSKHWSDASPPSKPSSAAAMAATT